MRKQNLTNMLYHKVIIRLILNLNLNNNKKIKNNFNFYSTKVW